MMRYAVRVTPWALLGIGCGVIGALMALVAARPYSLWPLEGTAVGVIAGVVGWAMDERCAAIADTTPRGLAWRTAARSLVVVPALLALWVGCLLAMRDRIPDHVGLFIGQGVGAVTGALAIMVWRRAGGTAEPGTPFAATVIPMAAAVALTRPIARWLPVFPIWSYDKWSASRVLWAVLIVASCVGLVAANARSRPHGGSTWR
jgi:hypothetical protein